MNENTVGGIYVFWHVYASDQRRPWCQQIVKRQYDLLVSSGLADKSEAIYVCYVGRGPFPCQEVVTDPRFTLRRRAIEGREVVTTGALHEWARQEAPQDACVLYMHNKGERWPPHAPAWDWTRMLEYFVIDRYEDALENLKTSFTTGPCLIRWDIGKDERPADLQFNKDRFRYSGVWHYSGNFFWARASYLASLPEPGGTPWSCGEFWHLRSMGEQLKPEYAKCMHSLPEGHDLYKHHYPRNRYAKE